MILANLIMIVGELSKSDKKEILQSACVYQRALKALQESLLFLPSARNSLANEADIVTTVRGISCSGKSCNWLSWRSPLILWMFIKTV